MGRQERPPQRAAASSPGSLAGSNESRGLSAPQPQLHGRPGMYWNEPARRSYGNAADLHHPRPGDGQIRDSTLSLRRPNPGRSQGHRRDTPGPSRGWEARGVLMKKTPHHSGEHRQPQRPRTHICGNTGLPGGFPAPQERGGMRLRSPAARGPGGETPPASGPG